VPIDDLEERFDVSFDLEDVETVGGLLATELGRVPIAGATVELQGLRFTAEGGKGRRNQVGTVLIARQAEPAATKRTRS
jgi:Mg2+/Co2+ transporter CorC